MPDEKRGGATKTGGYAARLEKYQQLSHRHAPTFIRHVLDAFRQRTFSAGQAAEQLGLSPSRLYALSTAYNTARVCQPQRLWTPGTSGGDHATAWPQPVLDLLQKRLACTPPCPYGFAASEALRLHAFKLDRAQVRRWALENQLAHAVPPQKIRAAVRRWQRTQIGELWQLDASPHRWFPHSRLSFPMLNLLDDCSRLFTGSKIYERELLLSYFDFLPAAFLAHGRPLQIYVDYHSLFFTHDPDALTQLGWALKFYDISFLYAPTPQAKGKIERAHQYWQGRLPAYFASEKITEIEVANPHIDALRDHRNAREVHRELRQTPQRAWDQARKEQRSVLRPAPRCPWWDYVWSVRTAIQVGSDGRVPIGTQRLRIEKPPQTKVVLCLHPTGHHSVLAAAPDPNQKPVLLFTNRHQ
ncbi:MAG TPA: hypothetical protein VF480_01825 [Verrucomicrobiae bacterium]|jgi:hypothetical protein